MLQRIDDTPPTVRLDLDEGTAEALLKAALAHDLSGADHAVDARLHPVVVAICAAFPELASQFGWDTADL